MFRVFSPHCEPRRKVTRLFVPEAEARPWSSSRRMLPSVPRQMIFNKSFGVKLVSCS